MPEAVLVSAVRTPVGTAVKGTLRDTTAFDLAHHIVAAAAATDGLDPDAIDDVILGEGLYGGGVVARHAALTVGLTAVPGLAHNRHCAAGLAAVQSAAGSIRAGMDELVIAERRQLGFHVPETAVPRRRGVGRTMEPAHTPRPARRPQPGHVDHGRLEHRRTGQA